MHFEAKRRIAELIARTGHVLTVEDFDDLAAIDKLASKLTSAADPDNESLIARPVYIGTHAVYPLTIAHSLLAEEVMAAAGDDQGVALLWVTTLPEVTDKHWDMRGSRKAWRKWARRCRWTQADAEHVMEMRYGHATEGGESGNPDYGALVAMLCHEYGNTPEYWIYSAPISVVESMVDDFNARQDALSKSASKAGGKPTAPAATGRFVTMRKLREACDKLGAKWQARH